LKRLISEEIDRE